MDGDCFEVEAERTMPFAHERSPEVATHSTPSPFATPPQAAPSSALLAAANDQHLLALVEAANVVTPASAVQRTSPPPLLAVPQPPPPVVAPSRRGSHLSTATPPRASLTPPASVTSASLAPPPPHVPASAHVLIPTDFERCSMGLQQLQQSLNVARRVDDLARTLKYVNDDITSLAIASFSGNDLWKCLGYRGTPDDAKFHLRKRRLDVKATMMRAAAMDATSFLGRPPSSSGAGGAMSRKGSAVFVRDAAANSDAQLRPSSSSKLPTSPSAVVALPLDLTLTASARFTETQKHGGVLADESTEVLVLLQQFISELAEGQYVTAEVRNTLLDFPLPDGTSTPSPSTPGSAKVLPVKLADDKQPSRGTSAASIGSDIGVSPLSRKRQAQRKGSSHKPPTPPPPAGSAAPLATDDALKIRAPRQKELDIQCRFAHDLEIRELCIEEERRFQRIFVLEVLSLIAVQQLEYQMDVAKLRLQTCEVLQHRRDSNPERAATDEDLRQCVELIPDLKAAIGHSAQQLQMFEQKYHRRFHRALTESVGELCGFNREVHRWNHYVNHRATRHSNAKRRTLQSLFTALVKLENGELSLDKNPEVFVKVQLFEKLDSTITLARQAQDMLSRYKQRLAVLDKLPNGKITTQDLDRWTVELKRGAAGLSKKSRSSATSSTGGSGRDIAKKKALGGSSPQSTSAMGSIKSLGSKVAKSMSAAPSVGARSRRSSFASSVSAKSDGGGGGSGGDDAKPPKRWRFKLYDEAHDDDRQLQYDALIDEESNVVFRCIEGLLGTLADSVAMWTNALPPATAASAVLPRVSSSDGRHRSVVGSQPGTPVGASIHPPPRPIQFFYVALLSVVSDVLDAFHAEIGKWDDADLIIDSDDDQDDPTSTDADGDAKSAGRRGSQDPLNRSTMSSSSFGGSAASTMGRVPTSHIPPWVAEEEQQKNAYRVTVLRLTKAKQTLSKVISQVFGGSHDGGGGGGGTQLKKYDPTKHPRHRRPSLHDPIHNADDTLFRVYHPPGATPPPAAAAAAGLLHSPLTPMPSGNVSASTSGALVPIELISTCPEPIPLPRCLVELEERERDLIILRPGEMLVPPASPPLWMSGGASSSPPTSPTSTTAGGGGGTYKGKTTFLDRLVKTLQRDAQAKQHLHGSLSLEMHQPFWRAYSHRQDNHTGGGLPDTAATGPPPLPLTARGFQQQGATAQALRSLGGRAMTDHQPFGGAHGARPPTAPSQSNPKRHDKPQRQLASQPHVMLGLGNDWTGARRWSADTTATKTLKRGGDGSSPVSPTGMPETFSWTPTINAGGMRIHHAAPPAQTQNNKYDHQFTGDIPALGDDETDGGFAPWTGGFGSGGGGGGSSDGDSWRSRPGTGSHHAAALKQAKLRLAPPPRGSSGEGGADRHWAPSKPFR